MLKIACPDWQFGVLVAIYSAFGSVWHLHTVFFYAFCTPAWVF
jgi:hypothetical protein